MTGDGDGTGDGPSGGDGGRDISRSIVGERISSRIEEIMSSSGLLSQRSGVEMRVGDIVDSADGEGDELLATEKGLDMEERTLGGENNDSGESEEEVEVDGELQSSG